jgi:hypothetical protein
VIMAKMPSIRRAAYQAALRDEIGWCTVCLAFTTPGLKYSSRRCTCKTCGKCTAVSADKAWVHGYFRIEES